LTNLGTRVLVAVIGIPLVLFLTLTGGVPFFLLVAAISTAGLLEFFRLARQQGAAPQTAVGVVFGLLLNAAFFHDRLQYFVLHTAARMGAAVPFPSMPQVLLILFLLFVPLLFLVELFRNRPSPTRNIAVTLLGVLYVSFFLGSLIGLRELFIPADFPVYAHFDVPGAVVPDEVRQTVYHWGGLTVISLFAAIWLCDTTAYFAGTRFGRHKLFPRVSPNKSWEGALAGGVAAVATFAAARALLLPYMSVTTAIVCGGIVGVFGQLGDMAESLMKRDAGVKDSSALLPGHGGILDRFDSLIFVSPLIYVYLDFVVF
jgi:phosphatidate cytidylyltransferase